MTGRSELESSRWAQFITRTPLLLSRHLWVWPLLGAVALGTVGVWVRGRVEGATRAELASRLQTLLAADVAALRLWFSEKQADAISFASDARVQGAIVGLAELTKASDRNLETLANSVHAEVLRGSLTPLLENQQYLDYLVLGRDHRILASPHARLVGRLAPRAYDSFVDKAFAGQPAISRPFAPALRDPRGAARAEGPIMFVASPVKATNGTVVAALALRMKPEEGFSRVFSVARMGETGEAYAFDLRGMMLTASRFDLELKALGLIPQTREATAILNLRLLDPGVDLQAGDRPKKRREEWPLTRMASLAVLGDAGFDVQGYRNYRGVRVVGAWEWLPEFGMGVATEVSAHEAFQTLYLLRQAFLVLFLLLVLSAIAIFAFTLLVERLQASMRRDALNARRVGQYVLMQEIGRGANGMVYRARHELLRRPVAIKLLSPDLTNEDTAARFEHEVQITSQLTHPNTVSIYDYGHTPEGLFYYAMEYLSGINLDQLVRRFGPQPEGRVIHILRQVCGSLAEAHRTGLIHRDIKPANIVLTRRGGVSDMVKVLDFGLVKARRPGKPGSRGSDAVVGTPHYMSPEAITNPESVDEQSDIYSLGALGYWLLTGRTLFDCQEVEELLEHQAKVVPARPSEKREQPVSADLEAVLMQCLAKIPEERPLDVESLDKLLTGCAASGTWTSDLAEEWWKQNMAGVDLTPSASMLEKTLIIAPRN